MKKLFALAIIAGAVALTGCKKSEPLPQPISQAEVMFKCVDTKFSISLDDVPQEVDSKQPEKIWEEFEAGVKKPYFITFSDQLHHLNHDGRVLYFDGASDNVRSYSVKIQDKESNANRLVGLISEQFENEQETVFIHVVESNKQDMVLAILVQAVCQRVSKKSII